MDEGEIFATGFNVVVYANHLLRAAWQAMKHTAVTLLEERSSLSLNLMPIAEVLKTIENTITPVQYSKPLSDPLRGVAASPRLEP